MRLLIYVGLEALTRRVEKKPDRSDVTCLDKAMRLTCRGGSRIVRHRRRDESDASCHGRKPVVTRCLAVDPPVGALQSRAQRGWQEAAVQKLNSWMHPINLWQSCADVIRQSKADAEEDCRRLQQCEQTTEALVFSDCCSRRQSSSASALDCLVGPQTSTSIENEEVASFLLDPHKDNCRMLTEIPVKDWIGCAATPSSLSALVGAIVPGQLRKLETVFEVVGLQVLGLASVKADTDQWLIDSCTKCKKAAPCEAESMPPSARA
eukprot:s19_g32.t1